MRTIAISSVLALGLFVDALGSDARAEASPTTPSVDDPMLAAVAPPARALASWDEARRMLDARSSELRIARADVARADGLAREALAGLLPTITATGNLTRNLLRRDVTTYDFDGTTLAERTVTVPDAWTYGGSVSLTQPLFAPRAVHARGTAGQAVENAKLSLAEQRRQVVLGVANAIVAVVTAERVAELDRIGLRAALERLDLALRRANLGAASALDVVRAREDVALARAATVTGDESVRQTREALGIALGLGEPLGVAPSIRLDALEASARAECRVGGTIDDRPDLAALRGASRVAERAVTDVELQFSPTVNLVSTLTAASTPLANTGHETWTVAGVLSVPIWDGGFKYGALADARAQTEQASERLASARRAASVQIAQARRAVEVADASLAVATTSRDLAAETERLARVAFEAGKGTSLELVESGRHLREAATSLALKELEVVRARIGALLAIATCE